MMVSAKQGSKSRVPRIKAFSDYQKIVEQTDERKQRIVSLLGLVGEVGDLHSMFKKLILQRENGSFREELREEFGDVLWYLTSLASLHKISLQEIVDSNAEKAKQLYSLGTTPSFDSRYPEDERFPREFTVNIYQKHLETGTYVKISINDVVIGDALTEGARGGGGGGGRGGGRRAGAAGRG